MNDERTVKRWPDCADCGHTHAGPQLAHICIGCPCSRTGPAASELLGLYVTDDEDGG